MKAIIVTGGKQYYVEEGSVIYVEKLDVEAGKDVTIDTVLMANGVVGTPYVKGRYTEKNSVCYVNNGSGHWFPIRINCPREITVITFFDGVA